MLTAIIQSSIRFKKLMFVLLLTLLAVGGWAANKLPIDAVPDVSTIQVAVLTDAPSAAGAR